MIEQLKELHDQATVKVQHHLDKSQEHANLVLLAQGELNCLKKLIAFAEQHLEQEKK